MPCRLQDCDYSPGYDEDSCETSSSQKTQNQRPENYHKNSDFADYQVSHFSSRAHYPVGMQPPALLERCAKEVWKRPS